MTAAYVGCLVVVFLSGAVLGRWLNRCIRRLPFRETFVDCWDGCVIDAVRDLGLRQVWWRHLPIVGWYRATGLSPAESGRRAGVELLTGLLLAALYTVEVATWSATPLTASMTAHFGSPLADPANQPHAARGPASALSDTRGVDPRAGRGDVRRLRPQDHSRFDHAAGGDFWARVSDRIRLRLAGPGLVSGTSVPRADGRFGLDVFLRRWRTRPGMARVADFPQRDSGVDHTWPRAHALSVALAGGVVGAGVVWGVRIVGFRALGQEAMGFGDVTLMGMIGLYLGWQPVLAVFVYAPMIALVVAGVQWLFSGQKELPFGPYLSVSTLLVLLGWRWFYPPVRACFRFSAPSCRSCSSEC